jgi:hypothetical protein
MGKKGRAQNGIREGNEDKSTITIIKHNKTTYQKVKIFKIFQIHICKTNEGAQKDTFLEWIVPSFSPLEL